MTLENPSMKTMRIAALALLATGLGACDNETTTPSADRVYNQIERLGNPLVSEVMIAKREHTHHNTSVPSEDRAAFADDLEDFVRTVAGRNNTVATTLSTVLLPDMLIVQTDKAANTAGWLSWALANGYGGRRLSDDVVDAGLAAIFGSLLSAENVSPGLATDNVGANDKAFGATFPYLAEPTR
jgi:hypothetical protein